MDYIADNIIIRWPVSTDYIPGDYVKVFTNSGDGGAVDFDSDAEDGRKIALFPNNTGYFGFGHETFGHNYFCHGESRGTIGYSDLIGFGHYPFGHYPLGHSPTFLEVYIHITQPGYWGVGLKAFDRIGNSDAAEPDTDFYYRTLQPRQPDALVISAYDSISDTLTFTV